ncbi:MAG: hypothetical protein J5829_03825 [Lachnospiraceae bacterium]|nr:hypothetical protein [Lachnospiraceae bacterium]
MSGYLFNILITFLIAFMSIGMPAIKRSANEAKRRVKTVKRKPSDFGNITLDGVRVSERGRGVLNPSKMYSETNRDDQS